MKLDEIKTALCKYLNGIYPDLPFIKAPTNTPAPVGNYIAIRALSVEQYGSMIHPLAGENVERRWAQVATIQFTEIEGDGDNLRIVRNSLETAEFISAMRKAGFTFWDYSEISQNDTWDGEFIVRQQVFTVRVNFVDVETINQPKIETVEPITYNITN